MEIGRECPLCAQNIFLISLFRYSIACLRNIWNELSLQRPGKHAKQSRCKPSTLIAITNIARASSFPLSLEFPLSCCQSLSFWRARKASRAHRDPDVRVLHTPPSETASPNLFSFFLSLSLPLILFLRYSHWELSQEGFLLPFRTRPKNFFYSHELLSSLFRWLRVFFFFL